MNELQDCSYKIDDNEEIPELQYQVGIFRIHRNARETECRGREITRIKEFEEHSKMKIEKINILVENEILKPNPCPKKLQKLRNQR